MKNTTMQKGILERIAWVDVLKALGMIAIYLGHEGANAGKLYLFVYTYHVPLFFFVSGFFSKIKDDESYMTFVKRRFLNIMIPYLGYVIISIIVLMLLNNYNFSVAPLLLKNAFLGIRNQVFPSSVWFLPCLFIVSIIFNLILRIVKKTFAALVLCIVIYILSCAFIYQGPSWFWNLDSALYYIVYYALGAFAFPLIQNFSYKRLSVINKAFFLLLVLVAICYAVMIYFKGTNWLFPYISTPLFCWEDFITLLSTILLIFTNVLLAFLLKNLIILKNIGENTLIHCGFEFVVKTLFSLGLTSLSLKLDMNSPLAVLAITILLLYISNCTIVRLTNQHMPFLTGKYKWK